MEDTRTRIDQWLWAVRIYKTRAIAYEACKKGRVEINGRKVKPSHTISSGQIILVKKNGFEYTYEIEECIKKRVGPKKAEEARKDLTPHEEIEREKMQRKVCVPVRARGAGRPSKKERRDMERYKNGTR